MITCVSIRRLAASLIVALEIVTSHSAEAQTRGKPTLPGECCGEAPVDTWTSQEKWVWSKVCLGEIADFNQEPGYCGNLDPHVPQGWPKSRVLTSEFLETILLHEPFRSAQHRRGVRIVGAWFKEKIDLSAANLTRELWLDQSRLDEGSSFAYGRVPLLSLEGSVVGKALDMSHSDIGTLNILTQACIKIINLEGATIRGNFRVENSSFSGSVIMDDAEIGGWLILKQSKFAKTLSMKRIKASGLKIEMTEFQAVDLPGANIKGALLITDSTFAGDLNMNSISLGSRLMMDRTEKGDQAVFQNVDLIEAKIEGQLIMSGSEFKGKLSLNSAELGSHIFMQRDSKFRDVDLRAAKIEGRLTLKGSTIAGEFNMAGATVTGEFTLHNEDSGTVWEEGSVLDVRQSRVGRLVAREHDDNSSPELTKLAGFTYDVLGSSAINNSERDSVLNTADFIERWLERGTVHSPHDHNRLADVLRRMGFANRATRTLYKAKNHELWRRQSLTDLPRAGWLLLLWATIGYGYQVWQTLLWGGVFVLIGWVVARKSDCKVQDTEESIGFWYSVERFLPVVELRKSHYKTELPAKYRRYFYVHTIMGYLLATFMLAGLSGLVK